MGWDAKFGLVKINPLLRWTKKTVWDFVGIGDNTSEQGPFWNANTWGQKAA